MRPILFSLGPLPVHSYGLAVAIGFVVGVVLAARAARRAGLDPAAVVDLTFWVLVAGIGGSRALYVLQHAGAYAQLCLGGQGRTLGRAAADCAAPLMVWQGGLVFHGGALAAGGAVALFARRRRWSFAVLADLLAPPLALGHAVGRLGCFLAGCCWGQPAGFGVRFPPGSVAHTDLVASGALAPEAPVTPPLHPTQLYEAGAELAIFAGLLLLRRRAPFPGAVALAYVASYGALRTLVEVVRGDPTRNFAFGAVSWAQIVGVIAAVAASVAWLRRRR